MLPDAIHHDPSRQRVFGSREPVRQLKPPAALSDFRFACTGQHLREATRHGLPESLVVAANEYLGVLVPFVPGTLGSTILSDNRLRNFHRGLVPQGVEFGSQSLKSLLNLSGQPLGAFRR